MAPLRIPMARRLVTLSLAGLVGLLLASLAQAGPPFTNAFPIEEFAARRAKLLQQIGNDVAVLQGAAEYPAYVKFRQSNQFFYLTGVEVPRAILVLDGRSKQALLFVAPRDERMERSEGPVLVPGDEAAALTGIDKVLPRDEFGATLAALAKEGRTLYLPHRMEALGAGSPDKSRESARSAKEDPWDGRLSREAAFIERVRGAAAGVAIKDLDPLIDTMRLIKSPREIALIKEATRIAGLGIMESMRSARPGMYEYELEAVGDYVFKRHNAQGIAYFGLVAAGTNAFWPHYHAAQSQLKAGDLVLYDYAPDYKYYSSDVTRMFPASGKFTADQREAYVAYLRMYQALMSSIRPNRTGAQIRAEAAEKMRTFLASYTFANPKNKAAAERFAQQAAREGGGPTVGHMVGMEVHDITVPFESYQPGMVFTIEPALVIPEDRVYIRLEDVLVITETGVESLSAFVPVEPEAIEKLMAEPGVADAPAEKGLTISQAPLPDR